MKAHGKKTGKEARVRENVCKHVCMDYVYLTKNFLKFTVITQMI